jgi:WD40 repeat protein
MAEAQPRVPGAGLRTVRVFISSTFRDMHAERDHLSRMVFPELRSRCVRRGAEFIGLDLRWGVTEEEAERQGALAICLEEIERCRPFFVCLLGERFGWVPPPEEVPQQLFEALREEGALIVEAAAWYHLDETSEPPLYRLRRDERVPGEVAEHLARFWEAQGLPLAGESITAREILRAVFEEGYPASRALFYLRRPGIEADPAFPPELLPVFVEQDPHRRTRLAALKERIRSRSAEVMVREYETRYVGLQTDPALLPPALSPAEREALEDGVIAPEDWPLLGGALRQAVEAHGTAALSGMEALGQQVLEDLWAAIEAELARPVERVDAHEQERAYHERFVAERTRLFLGRQELLQRMLAHMADREDRKPLVVTGEPGSGKSALLAECARRCRELFPDALVLPHFIGASPGSTALGSTLRSLCEALRRGCGLEDELPDDPQELRGLFSVLLGKAAAQQPVVLLLDAVNQLDPLDRSHELGWFPFSLPPGVSVIVSTLPGDCLDRLRRRVPADHFVEVPMLPEDDRRTLVQEHLARRRKRLSGEQLARLLDTEVRPDAGLPLYLLVALEELCLFGDYEALTKRIDLLPPTLSELFQQVLARLEQDHGRDMSQSICRWLAVSRSGLLESEVLDLLAGGGAELPRARWTRFYRALEFYLRPVEETTGVGLLDFYHDQLRLAVYRRHLDMSSPESEATDTYRTAHRELAVYFRSIATEAGDRPKWRTDRPRGLSEVPYHQAHGQQWHKLKETLTTFGFLEAKVLALGPYPLIEDYDLALVTGFVASGRIAEREAESLRSIQGALRLSNTLKLWDLERSVELATLRGHTGPVLAVAVTADGRRAVSGSHDNTLKLWDLESGSLLHTLEGHDGGVWAVAVTADGRRAVSGSQDDTLKLWDLKRGVEFSTLHGHADVVWAVAVTADGRQAVSSSYDNTFRLWDLERGVEFSTPRGHAAPVWPVAVTADGRRAVSGSDDDSTVKLWDLERGEELSTLRGHDAVVRAVAVTANARRAVSGSQDDTLKLWDLERGVELATLRGHTDRVNAVAVTANGRRAVSGSADHTVKVWDLERGEELHTLRGHDDVVSAVAVTADGRQAASGSWDGTLKLWDLERGMELSTLRGHAARVNAVAVSAHGWRAVSSSDDDTLKLWNLERGEALATFTAESPIWACALAPDGLTIVAGDAGGRVHFLRLEGV